MRYSPTSYEQLIRESNPLVEQFVSCGLLGSGIKCRFHEYRDMVAGLESSIKLNKLESYTPEKSPSGEGYFAVKQLSEMNFIFNQLLPIAPYMKSLEREIMYERLKTILSGPAYPKNEKRNNNAPRNIQFELLMAARLVSYGYRNVRFNDHPDILVNAFGRLYPIECKRITSDSDMGSIHRVEDAIDQLNSFPVSGSIGGIVAVDLSRLYEWPNNVLESTSMESASNYAHETLKTDLYEISRRSQKVKFASKNGNLIALFAGLSTVYTIPASRRFGWICQTAILVFNDEKPAESKLFMRDFAKLEQ